MATYTKTCSNNSSYTLRLELSESDVNISNNTSVITYSMYLDSTGTRFEDWDVTYTLYIGNEVSINTTENMSMPSTRGQPLLLTSGSKTITHNSDGKKSLSVSCSVSTKTTQSYLPGSASISGQTFTLTTIARKSTLVTKNGRITASIATASTLQVNRQSSSFTHTIKYSLGSVSKTIVTKSSSTSLSWTPPISLYSQMVGKSSEYGTITIETFNGSTSLGVNSYPLLMGVYNSVVYNPPSISGLTYQRGSGNSDSTWKSNPNGSDVRISYTATITSGISGNKTASSVKMDGTSKYSSTNETSGTKKIYVQNIGITETHSVVVSMSDTIGATSRWTLTISTISVPFDINVDLPGAAFGKVAEKSKALELAADWDLHAGRFIYMGGSKATDAVKDIYFQTTDGAANPHNTSIYGGNGESTTAWGVYDTQNERSVIRYNDAAGTLQLLGSTLADYVVERGKSNSWHYEKWRSGVVKAWRQTTSSNLGAAQDGGVNGWYYRIYTINLPSGMFKTITSAMCNCRWGTGISFASARNVTTTSFEAVYLSNQNGGAGTFWHEVIGTWK